MRKYTGLYGAPGIAARLLYYEAFRQREGATRWRRKIDGQSLECVRSETWRWSCRACCPEDWKEKRLRAQPVRRDDSDRNRTGGAKRLLGASRPVFGPRCATSTATCLRTDLRTVISIRRAYGLPPGPQAPIGNQQSTQLFNSPLPASLGSGYGTCQCSTRAGPDLILRQFRVRLTDGRRLGALRNVPETRRRDGWHQYRGHGGVAARRRVISALD